MRIHDVICFQSESDERIFECQMRLDASCPPVLHAPRSRQSFYQSSLARQGAANEPGSNGFCGSVSGCNVCYETICEFSGSGMTEMSSKDFPDALPRSFFNS